MAGEDEEFEFRLRAERERGLSAPTTPRDESFWGQAARGASGTLDRQWLGIKQLSNRMPIPTRMSDPMDQSSEGEGDPTPILSQQERQQNLQQLNAQASQMNAQDKAEAPTTFKGKLGHVVGSVAPAVAEGMMVPGEGWAGVLGSSAALGAAEPTTTEQPSFTKNVGLGTLGGVLGKGAAMGLNRLAAPITNRLSNTQQAFVDLLKAKGVPLDLAQQTGSKAAGMLKRLVQDNPLFSNPMEEQQAEAFTKAALAETGETGATTASGSVMLGIRNRLKAAMQAQTQDKIIPKANIEPGLKSVEDNITQYVADKSDRDTLMQAIKNVRGAYKNGEMNAEQWQNLRENIADTASASSASGARTRYGYDIVNALDDAMQKSMSPDEWSKFMTSRAQYRSMLQIARGIDGTNHVHPTKLFNAIDTISNQNQSVFKQGDQNLLNVAQAGMNVLGKKEPNSYTTKRALGYAASMTAGSAIGAGTGFLSGGNKQQAEQDAGLGALGGLALPLAARNIVFGQGAIGGLARKSLAFLAHHTDADVRNAGASIGGYVQSLLRKKSVHETVDNTIDETTRSSQE